VRKAAELTEHVYARTKMPPLHPESTNQNGNRAGETSAAAMTLTLGLVFSFMFAAGATAIAPSLCELAAPVLCPGAVHTETRGIPSIGRRGGRTSLWVSYCAMETRSVAGEQTPLRSEAMMHPITSRVVLFAYGAVLSLVAAAVVAIRTRLRRANEGAPGGVPS
jgi:hypothetical protein